MANLRDLNQTNPFWDWVQDIERLNRSRNDNGEGSSQRTTPGRQDEENNNDREKPDEDLPDWDDEKSPPPPEFDGPHPPPPPPGYERPPSPGPRGPHHHPHHHGPGRGHGGHHRGGHFGPRGGHGHHRGGHHGGPGPHGFGGWGHGGPAFGFGPHMFGGRRRGGGNRGWEGMFGRGGFDMEKLGQMLKENLGFNPLGTAARNGPQTDNEKDFTPSVDVFDTTDAYYIHLSLAGAKKQDLDVSWDADNFQVIVSGIIHRPGDEEFLKTLAVDERDIGVFERKIKLGTRAEPVSVDADTISAKMEDGVLMIKVPKHEEFTEIKKVDIE